MHIRQYNTNGFALVEILVACAIITVFIFALFTAAEKGVQVSNQTLRQTQAVDLLQEGVEAVRSIRDTDWSAISGVTDGTPYYLSFDTISNQWSLTTTTPAPIDGIFTRSVIFETADRDSNDDIASGGTPDDQTKKGTVTVTFLSSHGQISKSIDFYIANIFN